MKKAHYSHLLLAADRQQSDDKNWRDFLLVVQKMVSEQQHLPPEILAHIASFCCLQRHLQLSAVGRDWYVCTRHLLLPRLSLENFRNGFLHKTLPKWHAFDFGERVFSSVFLCDDTLQIKHLVLEDDFSFHRGEEKEWKMEQFLQIVRRFRVERLTCMLYHRPWTLDSSDIVRKGLESFLTLLGKYSALEPVHIEIAAPPGLEQFLCDLQLKPVARYFS